MIPISDLSRQPDLREVVARVLASGWFIDGQEVAGFEAEFARYNHAAYCVGVGNGTDALELALRASGVGPGDEVATVANAGMYTTTALRAIRAVPLFIDVEPGSLCMCPASLAGHLGPNTRAVVVTHLYGSMADTGKIVAIASRAGIPVIEDCAQAHGASLQGRKAGSWGLAGCFSFYPTKNLGACGDAGAVVTSDPAIDARLRQLRQYGWTTRFHSTLACGRNSRLDEIQAAILRAKLPSLDERNSRRRFIAGRYSAVLSASWSVEAPPAAEEESASVAHLYVLRCRERDALRQFLDRRGIATAIHYPVPDHLQPSQAGLPFRSAPLPVTEESCGRILTLPCFPEMTDAEVSAVAAALADWVYEHR